MLPHGMAPPANPWAAQQYLAQQQAMMAQQMHAQQLAATQIQIPPGSMANFGAPPQKPEIISDEKLQEKSLKWQQLQTKRFAEKRKYGFVDGEKIYLSLGMS